ncbi:MAG TPA: hypothetical protein VLL74_03580, partial [Methanoregula sp.]|nr:hypothetical protein [Methanoregula sp.]
INAIAMVATPTARTIRRSGPWITGYALPQGTDKRQDSTGFFGGRNNHESERPATFLVHLFFDRKERS